MGINMDERFIVDKNGEQVGVILEIDEYRKLLEDLEKLEAIRAYNAAKASKDEAIPFDQAVQEIEQKRR